MDYKHGFVKLNIIIITVAALCFFMSACGHNGKASNTSTTNQNITASGYDDIVVEMPKRTEASTENDKTNENNTLSSLQDENYADKGEKGKTEQIQTLEEKYDEEIIKKLNSMTLHEKVAQMFIIFPESLVDGVPCVCAAGEATKKSIDSIPVGGIVYLSQNLKNPEQVKNMLYNTQQYSMERIGIPAFLSVDEEGGRIARIANNRAFMQNNVGNMSAVGSLNNSDNAFIVGNSIGSYLADLGFNLDFAPVADIMGEQYNPVISDRTFSSDPVIVSDMALAVSKGLEAKGVISVFKHFPGHGSTKGDPHKGYAYTEKTLEELKTCDLVPFQKAIEEDVSMIMVGHISVPDVEKEGIPASLSGFFINDLLRNEMGYDGVVVTDAMNMGAISDNYSADKASILAIKAGVDIVLMPKDFKTAYNGVLSAVERGEISKERIDESVARIIRLKQKMK